MIHPFSRTELLLGKRNMDTLAKARVAVFGVGGVGGYVTEALVRSGVGEIDIIDNDTVALTNLNRQIIALHSTLGRDKVDVMAERIRDINPDCIVHVHKCFFLPETEDQFDFKVYDYVVDAIDTVSGKIALVMKAKEAGTPIISSMGAGNKLDPTRFKVSDIYKTSVCPLAKVMRHELKKRGVKKLKVLWSDELPLTPGEQDRIDGIPEDPDEEKEITSKRQTPGSTAFVPSAAGLIIAAEVIKDLTGKKR